MRISAVAAAAGLPVKTVRYYADIGLVPAPARSDTGYRIYDEASLRRLVFVRRAREFGFSIGECRELLGLSANPRRASADVKRIAVRRLDELARMERELRALRSQLAGLVEACRGDQRPECPIIRGLEGDVRSEGAKR